MEFARGYSPFLRCSWQDITDMGINGRKHNIEDIVQMLTDASQNMIMCENKINKATERIRKSCNTQGTIGAVNKSILLTKIEDLKRLAALYRMVSEKYENSVVKLMGGIPEDEVMAELLRYNIFINDQLKSERESYEQVLSMINA